MKGTALAGPVEELPQACHLDGVLEAEGVAGVRIAVDESAGDVALDGAGIRAMRRFSASGTELPYDLEVEVDFADGRLVVSSLLVKRKADGPAVRTQDLMRVKLGDLLHQAVMSGQVLMYRSEPDETPPAEVAAAGPTPEALQLVARFYRLAYVSGNPPTVTVAKELGITRATAERWISRCRQQGYLGMSIGPQPGEATGLSVAPPGESGGRRG